AADGIPKASISARLGFPFAPCNPGNRITVISDIQSIQSLARAPLPPTDLDRHDRINRRNLETGCHLVKHQTDSHSSAAIRAVAPDTPAVPVVQTGTVEVAAERATPFHRTLDACESHN